MTLRGSDQPFDASLNEPDANQLDANQKLFEFIQALRREAGSADQDSPDELTLAEIVQKAMQHVPGSASAIMAMLNDSSGPASDIEMAVHIQTRQLGVY